MRNKEHVEVLREVMEARVSGHVANWEAPNVKTAIQAAIRALEAEEYLPQPHPRWSEDQDRQVTYSRGFLDGARAMVARYRALVEAAKALQEERIRRGTSQVSSAAWDVLADALDALEE